MLNLSCISNCKQLLYTLWFSCLSVAIQRRQMQPFVCTIYKRKWKVLFFNNLRSFDFNIMDVMRLHTLLFFVQVAENLAFDGAIWAGENPFLVPGTCFERWSCGAFARKRM